MLAHPTRSARVQQQLEDELNSEKANGAKKVTKGIKAKANTNNDENAAPSLKASNILLALKKRVDREIANKIISSEQDAVQI